MTGYSFQTVEDWNWFNVAERKSHLAGKFQSNMTARKDRKRYHFLLSSFDSEEKAKLSLSIQELGGTYFETPVSYASSSKINVRGLYFVVVVNVCSLASFHMRALIFCSAEAAAFDAHRLLKRISRKICDFKSLALKSLIRSG